MEKLDGKMKFSRVDFLSKMKIAEIFEKKEHNRPSIAHLRKTHLKVKQATQLDK